MADFDMSQILPCEFLYKRRSNCGRPTGNGWCTKHEFVRCTSCGAKAIQTCEYSSLELECAAFLCEKCVRLPSGGHVTREAALEIEKRAQVGTAKIDVSPRPAGKFGYLQLEHPAGFFPAQVRRSSQPVITTDIPLLFRIWEDLAPCRSSLVMATEDQVRAAFYTNGGNLPLTLITQRDYDELVKEYRSPFSWAEFTFSLKEVAVGPIQFRKLITSRAEELGVKLHHLVGVKVV